MQPPRPDIIVLVPPESGLTPLQAVADYCRREGFDAGRAEEIAPRAGCRCFRIRDGALLGTPA